MTAKTKKATSEQVTLGQGYEPLDPAAPQEVAPPEASGEAATEEGREVPFKLIDGAPVKPVEERPKPTIDPEFLSLIPAHKHEELRGLEEDILHDGRIRMPISVWAEQNLILDGHNRFLIAQRNSIPPTYEYISLPSREAALGWIERSQLNRRNLSDDQFKILLGREYNRRKGDHGGDRSSCQGENLPGSTAEAIAAEHGVSASTVLRAAADVAAIEEEAPDQIAEITSGRKTMREVKGALPPKSKRNGTKKRKTKADPVIEYTPPADTPEGYLPAFPDFTKSHKVSKAQSHERAQELEDTGVVEPEPLSHAKLLVLEAWSEGQEYNVELSRWMKDIVDGKLSLKDEIRKYKDCGARECTGWWCGDDLEFGQAPDKEPDDEPESFSDDEPEPYATDTGCECDEDSDGLTGDIDIPDEMPEGMGDDQDNE